MFQLQHSKFPLSLGENFDLREFCQGITAAASSSEIHWSRPLPFKVYIHVEGLLEGSAACGEVVGRAIDSPHVFQGST